MQNQPHQSQPWVGQANPPQTYQPPYDPAAQQMVGYPPGYMPSPYQYSQQSKYSYATFWRRFAALLIDGVLMLIVGSIFLLVLDAVTGIRLYQFDSANGTSRLLFSGWATNLIVAVYLIAMDAQGATLAKQWLGIRVTDANGNAPGLVRALRRYSLFLASIALSVLHGPSFIADLAWFFGCIAVIFTQFKQGLHDKLASTYVIRT